MRVVEFRTYKLRSGAGPTFARLAVEESLPMCREWGMDVVSFGQSVHDPDACYLIRAFDSLEHLQRQQDEFYGSSAWREGPREAIVGLIESDANAVIELSEDAIQALRRGSRT